MKRLEKIQSLGQVTLSGGGFIDSLTDVARVFLFAYSPALRSLVAWSKNADEVLGVKDTDILRDGNLFLRFVHPRDRFNLLSELEAALKGTRDYRETYRWIRPDTNEVLWLHCRASLVDTDNGNIFEGIIIDLSSELAGGLEQLSGPASVSTVLAALPDQILVLERDGRVLLGAIRSPVPLFEDEGFRSEEVRAGVSILSACSTDTARNRATKILDDLFEGRSEEIRERVSRNQSVWDVRFSQLLSNEAVDGVLVTIRDVTTLASLEKEHQKLKRSAGFSSVASGIIHNLNNSLQSIIGEASIIADHPADQSIVLGAARSILAVAKRTAQLGNELLTLDHGSLVPVDVNLATVSSLNRIAELFSSGLSLEVSFGTIRTVLGRQELLVSALLGILYAARESAPDARALTVRTFEATFSEGEIKNLGSGEFVKIILSLSRDTEIAPQVDLPEPRRIPEEVRARVNALLLEFGGCASFEEPTSLGVSATVYLPIAQSEQDSIPKSPVKRTPPLSPQILVVDDDPLVLDTMSAIISSGGFRTATAHDLSSSVKAVTEYRTSLRVVLVDAIMPGDDGASIIKRLRSINSDLIFLGFSGAAPQYRQRLLDAGAVTVLAKPIEPRSLLDTISTLLTGQQAA